MTVTDALIAFPFAYFMARVATAPLRAVLFVLVLLPLWSSYLARVYAWRLILDHDGLLNWSLQKVGLPAAEHRLLEHRDVDRVLLHLAAVHDRARSTRRSSGSPTRYIEASRDLGAKGCRTLRSVILPLALPGIVAGLDLHVLADARRLHHADRSSAARRAQFIGNVVYDGVNQARTTCRSRAAFAVVPLVVMGVYLMLARRARRVRGALDGDARRPGSALGVWVALVLAFLYIPIVDHLPLRVQLVERAELADRRPDDEVVLRRRSTTATCSRRSGCR